MAFYKGNQLISGLDLKTSSIGSISTPVGTVIPWMGDKSSIIFPDGFLLCDGSEISRTTYMDLFLVIGTKFGSGDGSTTFNLPNLTDARYLQGGEYAGTMVDEELPQHIHKSSRSTSQYGAGGGSYHWVIGDYSPDSTNLKSSIALSESGEESGIYKENGHVIPKSVTTLYLICYKTMNSNIGGGGIIDGTVLTRFETDNIDI